MFIGLRLLFHH